MKKKIRQYLVLKLLFILLFIGNSNIIFAQKSAFVNTQYILKSIPEYQDAQQTLNRLSEKWQQEINLKQKQLQEMKNKYQTESILLPADMKKSRQVQISKSENELIQLQQKKFGPNGALFEKRKELIRPIQEKIYNAIQTVASSKNIDMVFDKAGSPTLLYGNPKYDISDAVLDELAKVMQVSSSPVR